MPISDPFPFLPVFATLGRMIVWKTPLNLRETSMYMHAYIDLKQYSETSDKGLSLYTIQKISVLRTRFLAPDYTFNVILTSEERNLSLKDKLCWSQDVLCLDVSISSSVTYTIILP